MFIYACARSSSKERNLTYCLSELKDLKYFRLKLSDYFFNKLKYSFFKVSNKLYKFDYRHLQDNLIDHSQEIIKEKSRRIWYYGYFQGEKYLYNNVNDIRKCFEIKKNYTKNFKKVYDLEIQKKKYAVIHIRLTDYANSGREENGGPDMRLPMSYYHSLINKYKKEEIKFVILSDDIEKVKDEFSYLNNVYFSTNSAIIDFQFILNADICILSCSSFAWWGAWLNKKEKKIIYVPKNWLGYKVNREYPVNMIPDNWNKVNIEQ
tara:strand:+ start:274 stop:1062 length:789 start_codon:yes stop_codon:yes gene_type:complete